MPDRNLIVLKFGGSVLRSEQDQTAAAAEIYRWHREGHKVVAVASAYHGITDHFGAESERWGTSCPSAQAALLGAGETRAAAHLALAVGRSGLKARFIPVSEARLVAEGLHHEARPVSLDTAHLGNLLDEHDVLVVPGFQAVGRSGDPRLLGRGGSDLTALFLAERLGAQRCRLVKDTDGLFEWDPKQPGPAPRRYQTITWHDAAGLDDGVVQPRALAFAQQYQRPFDFAACGSRQGTLVGAGATSLTSPLEPQKPVRVALAGCGTVGGGLALHLAQLPGFEMTGVAVKNVERARSEIPADVPLVTDPRRLLADQPDVLVETMGGQEQAGALCAAALRQGIPVITANKDLLAERGPELRRLAAGTGALLHGAAACGGGAPMLERTSQLGRDHSVRRLRGIVNGTSNWILDRLWTGTPLDEAVREAQDAGYAETDPTADIGGHDAAYKICLLAQAAWGLDLAPSEVAVSGLETLTPEFLAEARRLGRRPRLVAEAQRTGQGVQASVSVQTVLPVDPLADVPGVANRLVVESDHGDRWLVDGQGAGRWPTAQAVLADLLEVAAGLRESPVEVTSSLDLVRVVNG